MASLPILEKPFRQLNRDRPAREIDPGPRERHENAGSFSFDFEQIAAAEIDDLRHPPQPLFAGHDREPYKIGMIVDAWRERRQLRPRDIELGTLERLRRRSVLDPLELNDERRIRRAEAFDAQFLLAALDMERSIAGDRHGILREAVNLHLAFEPMRCADRADENPLFPHARLGRGLALDRKSVV